MACDRRLLPGFGPALGVTVLYISVLVVIPIAAVFAKAAGLGWVAFWETVRTPRVMAAYRLSIVASGISACINAVCGLLVAWVLVRYDFFGKSLMDSLVDLPFALPTAVGGVALTTAWAPTGVLGRLVRPLGVQAVYTRLGVVIALTFIGLPFVVRTVQPVLQDLDAEVEEAAMTLGAGRWQVFRRVILPTVMPAVWTGFALALARALGEYGTVVFISGNMPLRTEIVPLLIMTKMEQFDYAGATAIGVMMLLMSFVLLLVINTLQWRSMRRHGSKSS
ncbi:MAG: sulfate ABC transporter permease subunit CysT [Firmicutes bacterium]|nr:sulfate ABC transporter permease subunit CysT [Bacillota bacterium]